MRSWGTGETIANESEENMTFYVIEKPRHQWLRRWRGRAWQQNLQSGKKRQHSGLGKMVLLMIQAEDNEEWSGESLAFSH